MLCLIIPVIIGLAFHAKAPDDPLKLFLLGWATVALTSFLKCGMPQPLENEILNIVSFVRRSNFLFAVLRIYQHNLIILMLCALLGKGYYGFVVSYTALVASALAGGYPVSVVFGAHTFLELYSYALATTRRKLDLVKSAAYLLVAAAFEVTAIRF